MNRDESIQAWVAAAQAGEPLTPKLDLSGLPTPQPGFRTVTCMSSVELVRCADEVRVLFVDATERPTQRPGPGTGRRRFYSGQKKRHTITHQVVAARVRRPLGPMAVPRRVRIAAERWRNPQRRHTLMVKSAAGPHHLMLAA